MAIKIFWTDFAKVQLRYVFDYHNENVSLAVAQRLVRGLVNEAQILVSNPEIGQVEDLLVGRKEIFRYLITGNYKLIYWVNKPEKRIEIVDVFDTRQNPVKIRRKK